ncbi:hypothetical protein C2S52_001914 [Perilla frutescens var. hirtella]|nr:hypothetical protein C2S52_001914 [Perilla frutescens var. hirtella]
MKRVVSTKSGKDIYGPKWQNIEPSSSESEGDDELHSPPLESTGTDQIPVSIAEATKPASPTITGHGDNDQNQIPKDKKESMYRAALKGQWVDAEILLAEYPNLDHVYLTEEGDLALHVASAMKHKEFVQKLIKPMSTSDLTMRDGRGYTACCYAALSGAIEIARVMIEHDAETRPNLATAHDENNETPLHKAAFQGNKKMVSYFLKCSEVDDLSNEEWFDILLVTIRSRMYDVALEILKKNRYIAGMANEEGTALHLLARQEISNARSESLLDFLKFSDNLRDIFHDGDGEDAPDFSELVRELWNVMENMGKSSLLELITKPHNILHDAAKEGHVGIVTMLIHAYPQLINDTDSNGYTIFHTAVKYRNINVFNLIYEVYPMIDLKTLISQDKSGDNILHLAAKLTPRNKMKSTPFVLMQGELKWFKDVVESVPPSCAIVRNKRKLTPKNLFSKEHKRLLKNSETWMINTADACMLIATILLSVMFAAAFTVPGGYDPQTGEPILAKRPWFKIFAVFEVLGINLSVMSIVMFRSIMASNFAEEDCVFKLAEKQMMGFQALLWSLVCAFSAFMSSISLFNLKMNDLVWSGFCILYISGFFWFIAESTAIYLHFRMKNSTRKIRHNIFN